MFLNFKARTIKFKIKIKFVKTLDFWLKLY